MKINRLQAKRKQKPDLHSTKKPVRISRAGSDAGWGLHPLESAAFGRRTPEAVIGFQAAAPRTAKRRIS